MAEVPGWYNDFIAAVVTALPRDIDDRTAIAWVKDPAALEKALAPLASGAPEGGRASTASAIAKDGAYKNDKTAEGWEIYSESDPPSEFSPASMTLATMGDPDDFIIGEEAVEKVQTVENRLGQRHVEYLLDYPNEIPEEFQKFSLVFAGTIWLSSGGGHQVPCISYRQGAWEFTFGLLEGGLDNRDRLVLSS
jgi:hypothetical protein